MTVPNHQMMQWCHWSSAYRRTDICRRNIVTREGIPDNNRNTSTIYLRNRTRALFCPERAQLLRMCQSVFGRDANYW